MLIAERIQTVKQLIRQLEASYHREPNSVRLLAVSKGQPYQAIELAHREGLCDFGENYLQEALIKINKLSNLPLNWHFIGSIQSNKTQAIADNFSWVHSISRLKIAEKLSNERSESQPALNVCIQINLDNEESKSGISPDLTIDLANDIMQLPRLCLRGLMVIPRPKTHDEQYVTFLRATQLLHEINKKLNINLDTLSMGMSDDLPAAIRAGSTMVRIGRSIFGDRNKS